MRPLPPGLRGGVTEVCFRLLPLPLPLPGIDEGIGLWGFQEQALLVVPSLRRPPRPRARKKGAVLEEDASCLEAEVARSALGVQACLPAQLVSVHALCLSALLSVRLQLAQVLLDPSPQVPSGRNALEFDRAPLEHHWEDAVLEELLRLGAWDQIELCADVLAVVHVDESDVIHFLVKQREARIGSLCWCGCGASLRQLDVPEAHVIAELLLANSPLNERPERLQGRSPKLQMGHPDLLSFGCTRVTIGILCEGACRREACLDVGIVQFGRPTANDDRTNDSRLKRVRET